MAAGDLVQSKAASGSNPTATLDAAATAGNTLILVGGHRSADATPSVSGYTELATIRTLIDNTSWRRVLTVWGKTAVGGETSAQLVWDPATTSPIVLAELEGEFDLASFGTNSADSGTTDVFSQVTGESAPSQAAGSLAIPVVFIRNGGAGETVSWDGGFTVDTHASTGTGSTQASVNLSWDVLSGVIEATATWSDTRSGGATAAIFVLPAASAGGQTIALGAAAETDAAPAATVLNPRTYALGVATETDAAQPLTVLNPRSYALGAAVEVDAAPALTVDNPRTYALGTATETDAAPAVTVVNPRSYTLGVATETDAAPPLTVDTGGGQTITLGVAAETNAAPSLTVLNPRSYDLGTATETDTAVALKVLNPRSYQLGIASETDTALGVTLSQTVHLGAATETDAAVTVTVVNPRTYALGVAEETDTALGLTIADLHALAPTERRFTIPAEDRAFVIPADTRTFTIPAEDRTLTV